MKLSNDKPIQIQSDQLEIKDAEKKAYFTGKRRGRAGYDDDESDEDGRSVQRRSGRRIIGRLVRRDFWQAGYRQDLYRRKSRLNSGQQDCDRRSGRV